MLKSGCLGRKHDAEVFVTYLKEKGVQSNDYVNFELNPDGTLTRVFWMTQIQTQLYVLYNDIILQDNTYKTNRYQFPLCFIAGVDGNYKSRLFAQSLTQDETSGAFIYIFENLLRASTGVYPVSILTDGDKGAGVGIAKVLPNTAHYRCSWHLSQDINRWLTKNGVNGLVIKEFMQEFWAVRNIAGAELFEDEWAKFVNHWTTKLEHVPSLPAYLHYLTSDKKRWANAYTCGVFMCGMSATSRIEGMFAKLNSRLTGASSLCDVYTVVENIENAQYSTSVMTENSTPGMDTIRLKKSTMASSYSKIVDAVENLFTRYTYIHTYTTQTSHTYT